MAIGDNVQLDGVSDDVEFRSLDGLRLRGCMVTPTSFDGPAAVLVHGGGVTREEGGFFARLAAGLAVAGVASLRFDLRGHGDSEGRQQELTLSAVVNDIRAAVEHIRTLTGEGQVNLLGTSFGGGLSAFFAARYPDQVKRLVLLNPLLDYKKRFIDDKPYWSTDRIDDQAGHELAEQGFVAHSPTFKLGRALLNEVFYLQPRQTLDAVTAPTLLIHGTGDTFIPVESSHAAVPLFTTKASLIEVDGAQHGFAVHDDPQYHDPQTQRWQSLVIDWVVSWFTDPS